MAKLRAWAIMPSFPDSKTLTKCPFLTENRQFMIYLTKKHAEKANENMDEAVVEVEIRIHEKSPKRLSNG